MSKGGLTSLMFLIGVPWIFIYLFIYVGLHHFRSIHKFVSYYNLYSKHASCTWWPVSCLVYLFCAPASVICKFVKICLNKVYFFVWEYFTLYSTVPVEEELILFSETNWCKTLIVLMNVGVCVCVCVHIWMKVFLGSLEVFNFQCLLLNAH
jgi:hypothetical protein